MQTNYRVKIESDGRDCDGYINHGSQTKIMTEDELAERIGHLFLRYGGNVQMLEGYEKGGCFLFQCKTEEGYARHEINFVETDEEISMIADGVGNG